MKVKLTRVTLHGDLGAVVGEKWDLSIKSVGEAIRAIEMNSNYKLYRYLLEKDKAGIKYRVLINERDFVTEQPLDLNKPETIVNSELCMQHHNLRSIDIVPVIEGADSKSGSIASIIVGVILVIIGAIVSIAGGSGVPLILAGVGLIAAGAYNLIAQPPKFEDFREIDGATGRTSYLFNGPQNVTREGGPVPVGYGRLIVGSQVIAAAYRITNISAGNKDLIGYGDPGTLAEFWTVNRDFSKQKTSEAIPFNPLSDNFDVDQPLHPFLLVPASQNITHDTDADAKGIAIIAAWPGLLAQGREYGIIQTGPNGNYKRTDNNIYDSIKYKTQFSYNGMFHPYYLKAKYVDSILDDYLIGRPTIWATDVVGGTFAIMGLTDEARSLYENKSDTNRCLCVFGKWGQNKVSRDLLVGGGTTDATFVKTTDFVFDNPFVQLDERKATKLIFTDIQTKSILTFNGKDYNDSGPFGEKYRFRIGMCLSEIDPNWKTVSDEHVGAIRRIFPTQRPPNLGTSYPYLAYGPFNNVIIPSTEDNPVKIPASGLIKLNTDGSMDQTFNATLANTNINGVVYLATNSDIYRDVVNSYPLIPIAGTFTSIGATTIRHIAILDYQGNLFTSFDHTNANPGSAGFQRSYTANGTPYIEDAQICALCMQEDGKLLVGGNFTSYNGGTAYRGLMRFNIDGTIDSSFTPLFDNSKGEFVSVNAIYCENRPSTFAIPGDNKILIGGSFQSVADADGNFRIVNNFCKLNVSDGSLDTTFDVGFNSVNNENNNKGKIGTVGKNRHGGNVDVIFMDENYGDIYIGGQFRKYRDKDVNMVARINNIPYEVN